MGNIRGKHSEIQRSGGRKRASIRGIRPGRRYTGKIIIWFALTWVFVLAGLILLMRLRRQMQDLNDAFVRLQGRVAVIAGDKVLDGRDTTSFSESAFSESVLPETVPDAENAAVSDYADLWGLDQVEKPKERTTYEILRRLEELGDGSELIARIAGAYQDYPEQLLEALANNPEMADFAAHYLENKGTVTGEGLTESEKSQEHPLFLQWDPRWGYASYGDDVVGLSGCGPTALSMVLYYLTGDEELTPDKIAAYSTQGGYYMSGTGTAWLLLEEAPTVYGVSVSQPEKNEYVMRQALDRGELIICSMGPGDFTIGGHFVVIYGYTEEGFLLNDPNCVARSRRIWSYSQIGGQIKHIWVFSK